VTDAITSLEAARERALREAASIDDDLSRLRQLHGEVRDMVPMHESFAGLKHRSWLVNGMIHRVGLGAIVSEPFVGKTLFMTYLACCVATGRDPWDGMTTQEPAPVLYLYGESDLEGFLWTFRKAYDAMGLTTPAIFTKPRGYRNSQLRVGSPGLESAIKSTGAGLVIFDTMAKFNRAKENDNNEIEEKFLEPATELAEACGCFLLFVHHEQKGAEMSKAIYRMRGASSIPAAMDVVLRLQLADPDAEGDTARVLHLEKVRGCPRSSVTLDFDFHGKTVRKI